MESAGYKEGYATGALDVLPIGDDGEMYIVPGHDPLAGFKIACYIWNEVPEAMSDVPDEWEARHIWVTSENDTVNDDWEDYEETFYRFWSGPVEGAEPYTAIGRWDSYRLQEPT